MDYMSNHNALIKLLSDYVTIAEYAKLHDIPVKTITMRIQRNAYKTAIKIGNVYILNKNETYIDGRNKNNKNIKNF